LEPPFFSAFFLLGLALDVEFEEEDVAIFDGVLFAFGAKQAGFFDGLLAPVFEEVGGGVAVGLDETLFEVGVDDACSAGGPGAAADGPGADLLHAGGEVSDEVEERVGGVDEAVEAGFFEAHLFQELVAFGGFELGDFGFHLPADSDYLTSLFSGAFFYGCGVGVAGDEAGLVDVSDVELGLCGDEEEVAGVGFFFVGKIDGARGLAGFEGLLELRESGELGFNLVIGVGGLAELFHLGVALVDGVEVGEEELGVDDVDVVEGVDAAGDVDDLGVVEAADDVADGVCGADVAEELIAEAFAFGSAFDETGDVDELHGGGDEGFGFDEVGDFGEALIGHGDYAGVGVDGAEGIVGGLRLGRGEGVEDGGLSDVGETNDSAVQWHCVSIPCYEACFGVVELSLTG
jgi:hypothetical protein